MSVQLFTTSPEQSMPTEDEVVDWYNNVRTELELSFLNSEEKRFLRDYYLEAGLLTKWRKPFFYHHYARTFRISADFLLAPRENCVILDLGCGCGTQSLFFAMRGAKVIALDLCRNSINILRKRKTFYESKLDRELRIQTYCVNAFDFNYKEFAPITGVYSMFAFNMMQPSTKLISILDSVMDRSGRIALLDGNCDSWLPRLVPSRRRPALSPFSIRNELEKRSFKVHYHRGGFAVPPIFWRLVPRRLLRVLDSYLCQTWSMAISHLCLAEKETAINEPSCSSYVHL